MRAMILKRMVHPTLLTVGFLYGAGAETLIFVTGASGKYPKLFVSRQKNQSQLWIPRKPREIGVWVSGAEIQTSAVDTRTGHPPLRKFPKSFWEKLEIFLESLGGSQRQLCIKTRPLSCQKNPRVRKIRVRNSGAGNGSPNFMDTWKRAFFLQENLCP